MTAICLAERYCLQTCKCSSRSNNRTRRLVYTSLISTNHSRNKRIFNVNVIELPVFQDLDIFACK